MERKPGRPRALTVEVIARAALDDGIATFSMPSVARRLNVVHSGLYRYVVDRDDLLVSAIDLAVRETAWPAADLAWTELLAALGESAWQLCESYPGFDRAALGAPVAPSLEPLIENYVGSMKRQGFSADDAVIAIDFVLTLALTSSCEVGRRSQPGGGAADGVGQQRRGAYDRKLQIVLTGLESQQHGKVTAR